MKANIDLPHLYAVDLLTGKRKPGSEQTMAESYVRSYQEIDQADETTFFTSYGGSIADVLNAHPVGEREHIARLVFDLHKRQAATVLEVLTNGIQQHSTQIARGQLPSSCVLMLAAASGDLIEKGDHQATEHQALAAPDDGSDAHPVEDHEPTTDPARPIVMLISKAKKTAMIKSCTDLSLRSSKLVLTLKPDYDSALREQLPMEKYQTCSVDELTRRLQVSDGSLRHQVAQLRREHREAAEIQGMYWAKDAIIQNIHGQGYRLNPMIRFENAD